MPVMAGGMTSVSVSTPRRKPVARVVGIEQQSNPESQYQLDEETDGGVQQRDTQRTPHAGVGEQLRPIFGADKFERAFARYEFVKAQPDVVEKRVKRKHQKHRQQGRQPG